MHCICCNCPVGCTFNCNFGSCIWPAAMCPGFPIANCMMLPMQGDGTGYTNIKGTASYYMVDTTKSTMSYYEGGQWCYCYKVC